MNYALLDENNIVTNIIWINPEQQKDFPSGIPTNDLPILPGDEYKDGKFYRNGEEITPESPTPEPVSDPYQQGYDQAVLDMIESGVL